jgi:hypothetical protein
MLTKFQTWVRHRHRFRRELGGRSVGRSLASRFNLCALLRVHSSRRISTDKRACVYEYRVNSRVDGDTEARVSRRKDCETPAPGESCRSVFGFRSGENASAEIEDANTMWFVRPRGRDSEE